MIFTYVRTAIVTDNPRYGHALHLGIGWFVGLVTHVAFAFTHTREPALLLALQGLLLGWHEVIDHDVTNKADGAPWNGLCDVAAFQPALFAFSHAIITAYWLLIYVVCCVFRGRDILKAGPHLA